MSGEAASSKVGGNFRNRLTVTEDILVGDFQNPWNFYFHSMCDADIVISWCRANGLLARTVTYPTKVKVGVNDESSNIMEECGGLMLPKSRSFRFTKNRNHERTEHLYSFFFDSLLLKLILLVLLVYSREITLYVVHSLQRRMFTYS